VKKRILIVDDDPDILVAVVQLLEEHGYEVEATGDSLHAYQLLRRRHYDAAVLDVKLAKGVTSAEILRGIFRDGKPRPPVIALSALPYDEALKYFYGALPPFVHKPFRSEELLQLVARLTGTVAT
jgi:two-component system response regulator VanR